MKGKKYLKIVGIAREARKLRFFLAASLTSPTLKCSSFSGASAAIAAASLSFTSCCNFSAAIGVDTRGNNQYWNGTMDEVAIWNRSLSADEILNLQLLK